MSVSTPTQTRVDHDALFHQYLEEIERRYVVLSKPERIRVEQWVKKLCEAMPNEYWKKNRNNYAQLLLHMIKINRLEEPFHKLPYGGPLLTLPTWMLADVHRSNAMSAHSPMKSARGTPAPMKPSADSPGSSEDERERAVAASRPLTMSVLGGSGSGSLTTGVAAHSRISAAAGRAGHINSTGGGGATYTAAHGTSSALSSSTADEVDALRRQLATERAERHRLELLLEQEQDRSRALAAQVEKLERRLEAAEQSQRTRAPARDAAWSDEEFAEYLEHFASELGAPPPPRA